MGTSALFGAYERSLVPDKAETDAAVARAVDCVVALNSAFYNSGDAVDRMTLIGSVVKSTSIKPISDVDVVFHMPVGTYARYDDYSGNGQSALLQEVRSVLTKRYPSTTIKGDGPVVQVGFTSGASVEVVPAVLHKNTDILHVECEVPVTRSGGAWEAANYGAQYDQFNALNKRRSGQLSRLLRYMKGWRRTQFAQIKSLVLELMAIDFFQSWDVALTKTTALYDDWLVRDFLAYMVANQNTVYSMAGTGKRIETGYGWRQDAAKSTRDAQTACQHPEDSSSYLASWRKVLGDGFGR